MFEIRSCRQTDRVACDTICTLLTTGGASRWKLCISGGRCLPRTSLSLEGVFTLRAACARLLLRPPSDADWRVRVVIALSNTIGLSFA